MSIMQAIIWIVFCILMFVPAFMLFNEAAKTERIQNEILQMQKDAIRRWDIRIKHASALSNRLSEIYNEREDASPRIYVDDKWEEW